MAQQTINTGTAANAKNGDPLRTAFTKVNANFTELYAGGASETQLTNGAYRLTLGSTGTLTLPGAAGHQTTFGSAGAIGDVLASVDDLVLKSKKSVTISSGEDIGALQTNYTNKLGLLSNALTAGNWNGVGTPASYTSYAALAAAKPSNPLILDNWLVLANEVLIAYNAWQAVLNASVVAIGVGDNGWGFGTNGNLTWPGGAYIGPNSGTAGEIDIIAGSSQAAASLGSNDLKNYLYVDNDGSYIYTNLTNEWLFGLDGTTKFPNQSLSTKNDLSIVAPNVTMQSANVTIRAGQGIPSATGTIETWTTDWNLNPRTNLPTTVAYGIGTGLTVTVLQSGGNPYGVTIVTPGSGYENNQVVQVASGSSLLAFRVVVPSTKNWTFGTSGSLTLPDASVIASYKPVTVIAQTSTTRTITDQASAAYILFVETVDTATAYANGVFIAPYTGYYQFNVSIYFSTSVTLNSGSFFLIDHSDSTKRVIIMQDAWSGQYLHYSTVVQATAGDTISCFVLRNASGANIELASGCRLTIHRVSIS